MHTRGTASRPLRVFFASAVALALALSTVVATGPQTVAAPTGVAQVSTEAKSVAALPTAAKKRGKVKVVVQTPKGVPATVVLSKGSQRVGVAKKASGKSTTVTRPAAVGTWKVSAKPVQYKGRIYVATVKQAKTKVRAGKTAKVTVVYKAAPTVTKLRVSSVATTKIGVSFKKPKATTKVKIRYAVGTKAPKSVKAGKAVKVGAKAKSATVKGLKPGTTYTISVFTRVGKKWVGPLTQTVGTKAKKSSTVATSTYIAAPDTVLVKKGEKIAVRKTAHGVSTTLPAGAAPVVGQSVVLPDSATVPGGFVGTVTGVAADGRTATLKQAALTEAFEYLDVSIPDLSRAGTEVSIASTEFASAAMLPPGMRAGVPSAAAKLASCKASGSKGITMPAPKFTSGGYFNMTVRTAEAAFVKAPLGVSLDMETTVTGTMIIGAHLDGAVKCGLKLPSLKRTFMAGPVPMALVVEPEATFDAKGSIKATGVGVKAKAGFRGTAYVPLPTGGKFKASSSVIREVTWLTPSIEASGTLGIKVGGELSFGPGGASDWAGAQAGLGGSLYALTAEAKVAANAATTGNSWCLSMQAGGEVSAEVFAKAWAGNWEAKASYEFIKKTWSYGSPYAFPSGCKQGTGSGPTDPEPTPGPGPTEPAEPPAPLVPGTVWAWGANSEGQLGDGTSTPRYRPVQVQNLSGVTAISGSVRNGYALKADGTVWAWGANGFGQFGDDASPRHFAPVQALNPADVIAIASGSNSDYMLKSDGTVWARGINATGPQEDGSWPLDLAQVRTLSDITAIASGDNSPYALKADGTVWSWGANAQGQVGDGTTTPRWTPVQVKNLTGVTAIAGSRFAGYALKADGTVWAWGGNTYGELGDGTWARRLTPVRVGTLTGVTAIAGGGQTGYALKQDGTVWSWGSNMNGQRGHVEDTDWRVPMQVDNLTGVISMAGSEYSGFALKSDGTVWASGGNTSGQLGDGTTTQRGSYERIDGLSGVTAIASGLDATYAIIGDD